MSDETPAPPSPQWGSPNGFLNFDGKAGEIPPGDPDIKPTQSAVPCASEHEDLAAQINRAVREGTDPLDLMLNQSEKNIFHENLRHPEPNPKWEKVEERVGQVVIIVLIALFVFAWIMALAAG